MESQKRVRKKKIGCKETEILLVSQRERERENKKEGMKKLRVTRKER